MLITGISFWHGFKLIILKQKRWNNFISVKTFFFLFFLQICNMIQKDEVRK